MTTLKRGMVIQANLDPTTGSETGKTRPYIIVTNDVYNERTPVIQVVPVTAWSEKKGRIRTNVELLPSPNNGLTKRSIADCLQTRPVDHAQRMTDMLGQLTDQDMRTIDDALKTVFALK
jgi:mRNA interferase MazF